MTTIENDSSTSEEINQELLDYIDQQESASRADVRPDGFGITVYEYAEKKGIGMDGARSLFKKLVKDGVLERRKLRAPNNPLSRPYVYYKPGEWQGEDNG